MGINDQEKGCHYYPYRNEGANLKKSEVLDCSSIVNFKKFIQTYLRI